MEESRAEFEYRGLMERFIEAHYEEERPAAPDEFPLYSTAGMLPVGEEVRRVNGRWMVYLIFRDPAAAGVLRRVPVRSYASRQVAEIVAAYQRQRHACRRCTSAVCATSDAGFCWN